MRMEDESKLKVIPVRIEAYFRQEHHDFKEICEHSGDNEPPLLPVEKDGDTYFLSTNWLSVVKESASTHTTALCLINSS